MNKIFIGVAIVGLISLSALTFAIVGVVGVNQLSQLVNQLVIQQTNQPPLGGVTNYDSLTLSDDLIVAGLSTLMGTSTIAKSPDGFVNNKSGMTLATTTSVRGYITNDGVDVMCDGRNGFLYANDTGVFAPSFVYSLFETDSSITSITGGTSITASTTVATSTDTITVMGTVPFVFEHGHSLLLSVGDITNTEASSTYYSLWSIEFGVHCWTLGQ